MSVRVVLSIAFLTGLALGILLRQSTEGDERGSASSFAETQRAHLRRLDGASADGRVVFLGGSTFQGLDVSSVTPVGLNLSVGGDTIPALTARSARYRSLAAARAVVINIGLNDLSVNCAQPMANIEDVFASIPATTPIVVLGVQSIDSVKYLGNCRATLNSLIFEFNRRLVTSCSARIGCVFVPNPVRSAITPDAIEYLLESDGVHLTRMGYLELSSLLRKALLQVNANNDITQ